MQLENCHKNWNKVYSYTSSPSKGFCSARFSEHWKTHLQNKA